MKKRNNTLSFIFFALIIVLIVGVLTYGVNLALKIEKTEYTIETSNILYTSENEIITLEETATLKKSWGDEFYLNNQKKQISLGKTPVIFDTSNASVKTYSEVFEVMSNGEMKILSGENKIENTKKTAIYKLADRKYLLIGQNFTSNITNFKTSKYLIITIDKSGNAFILNDEVNFKVLEPITIKTENLEFNIAKEEINYNDNIIDLKKINGSTNKYIEPEPEEEETPDIIPGGQGGAGGNGGTGGDSSDDDEDEDKDENVNKLPLGKDVSLRTLSSNITTIDVNYQVVDPENKYLSVFLIIDGPINGEIVSNKYEISKQQTRHIFRNLDMNSEYTITLGYVEMIEGKKIETIEDTVKIRTKQEDIKLSIEKVTVDHIYGNLKFSENFVLDSGIIELLIDGVIVEHIEIDIAKASQNKGFEFSFEYRQGREYVIRLNYEKYMDKDLNLNIQSKFINY